MRALGALAALLCLWIVPAQAGWYQNVQFGYQIHFPDGWRVTEDAANGGATATAPAQNVEIGAYAFNVAGKGLTPESLATLMAKSAFGDYRLLGSQNDVVNGIPGVTHMYGGTARGQQVVIGSFYMVQEPYGFMLSSMMLASQAQVLANQSDAVFKTFSRIAPPPPPPPVATAPAPAPVPTPSPYAAAPAPPPAPRPAVATHPLPRVAAAPLAPGKLPKGVDFGRYHALVIGNTGYASFPELKTAGDDARAVAALLKDSYGYTVTLVLDATRSAIIDALEALRATLTPDDNLLIYYAGHGWLDTKAERGYWLPVDANPDSKANWLSNATITDSIKAMDARHVIVVADSCYSGTLTRGIKITAKASADHYVDLARKRTRVVLTSGGLEPVSDSGGRGHSAFAAAFIDALAANDGAIEGAELFRRIERPVKLNADQTPAYSDMRKVGHEEGGDFVFVRKR